MKRFFIYAAAVAFVCSCGSSARLADNYDSGENDVDNEEINVGYGTTNSDQLTYSVSKVKIREEEISTYTNIWEYLQGRVPGVVIGPSSAGSTPTITVRGINTATGSNEPLIMVDGNEVSDVSFLSPSDVASVEVLKDASASIYGVRGANGVILFTTKAAKEAAAAEAAAKKAAKAAAREAKKAK
ncbi:MAG: TonB-dependent receptor plug domain-containing protein [Bacteroidia bacterium]|nr:TonB-dependent receptor plug domain-containing protein [Bacteroidia bacterium]